MKSKEYIKTVGGSIELTEVERLLLKSIIEKAEQITKELIDDVEYPEFFYTNIITDLITDGKFNTDNYDLQG